MGRIARKPGPRSVNWHQSNLAVPTLVRGVVRQCRRGRVPSVGSNRCFGSRERTTMRTRIQVEGSAS